MYIQRQIHYRQKDRYIIDRKMDTLQIERQIQHRQKDRYIIDKKIDTLQIERKIHYMQIERQIYKRYIDRQNHINNMKRLETSVTNKLQNKKCFRCYLLTIIVAGQYLEDFIENITITYNSFNY